VDDVNRLLDIDLNDPLAVRDRAMLEVMYGAGLRLSNWWVWISNTWIWKAAKCRVMGKGSKERRLPVGRNAVIWIEHWLDLRGLFGAKKRRCFSQTGNVFPRAMYKNVLPSGESNKG
jgi:integrase/recombinase XerC